VSKRKTPTTEEAQSKPTAELRREGRLARIARALASGATVTDVSCVCQVLQIGSG